MATLPESVDYTDKDFDALRARLIALVRSVFPDWTDFDVASFGIDFARELAVDAKAKPFVLHTVALDLRVVVVGAVSLRAPSHHRTVGPSAARCYH